MDDPLQNNGKLIKKIEDDIEVLIMLQTATSLSADNPQIIDIYDDGDTEVACIPENNNNTVVTHHCHALKHKSPKDIYPHEQINIRFRCPPSKPKKESEDSQGSNHCHKYFSSSQEKLTKTESFGKCRSVKSRTSSRCLVHSESRTNQENKYSKMRPEKDDDRSNIEESGKRNTMADCSRLYRDMEELKKKVGELIKVKTENGDLQCQLALIQREKCSLLSLVEAKNDSIKNFENSMDKMKCECECLLEEKDNKIKALMSENAELAKKVKELDMTIANMHGEAEVKEKSYMKDLAQRPSADEFEEQKSIWEGKIHKYQCIITEKDSYIQEIEEKYEELEVMYGKVEEESKRSLSAEKELTNSNIALEGKLSETEKSREELQEKLAMLEEEKEEKISELRNSVKELDKRVEELLEVNKKLEESLRLRAEKCEESVKGQSDESTDPENWAQIDVIKQELDETRKILEQEKYEVQRRGKIILDYEESIKKLKEQASQRIKELQKAITEKERAEMNMKSSFYQERRQNEILLNELTKLKWHEQQLTQELNETLQQLSEYEMGNADTDDVCAEHSFQLQKLEDEVEKKTAQWHSFIAKLTHERDFAIGTARAAREKLKASLSEFQKHFGVQRKIQEVLTGLLRQREYDLKCALTKIVKSRCAHSFGDTTSSVETDV